MNRRLGKFAEGEEEMKSHLRRAIAAKKAKQIHLSFSFSCKKLQKADTKVARQLQQFYANFGFCHSREAFTAKKCKNWVELEKWAGRTAALGENWGVRQRDSFQLLLARINPKTCKTSNMR